MRSASMFFSLLLTSATLTAQTTTGSGPAVLIEPPTSQSCPVQLSADRIATPMLSQTDAASRQAQTGPRGQGLQISFMQPQYAIVKAEITVHGIHATAHATPAAQHAMATPDVTETFELVGSPANPLLQSSIHTRAPMMITWFELTRLEFANGSAWHPSSASRCAAAPSLYVLVDSASR